VRVVFAVLTVSLAVGAAARAGPPLISDDPHTIGPGRVEWITATQSAGQPTVDVIEAPLIDVTVGLLRGLDFVVTGAPAFIIESQDDGRTQGNISAGFKWQPVDTPAWAVSLTPVAGVNVLSGDNPFFTLPLQVEYAFGRAAIGVDGVYSFVHADRNTWQVSTYGTWQATPSLLLLAELWALDAPAVGARDFGAGAGIEWNFLDGLSLLAMAGTGITSRESERVEWVGYLGVLWAFGLWDAGPGAPAAPALARFTAD